MDLSATYILLLPKLQSFSTKGCVYSLHWSSLIPMPRWETLFLPNWLRCIWLPNQLECIQLARPVKMCSVVVQTSYSSVLKLFDVQTCPESISIFFYSGVPHSYEHSHRCQLQRFWTSPPSSSRYEDNGNLFYESGKSRGGGLTLKVMWWFPHGGTRQKRWTSLIVTRFLCTGVVYEYEN